MLPRLLLLLLLAVPLARPGAAQPAPAAASAPPAPAAAPAMAPAELERLAGLLKDEAKRQELIRTLQALAAAARGQTTTPSGTPSGTPSAAPSAEAAAAPPPPIIKPDTVTAQLWTAITDRFDTAAAGLAVAIRSMADLPALISATAQLLADPVARTRLIDASWKLLLALGCGLLIERLARRLLRPARERLEVAALRPAPRWVWSRKLVLVLGWILLDLLPILAFAALAMGALRLLSPLPTTGQVGLTIGKLYVAARVAFVFARLLLAPGSQVLGLIPVSDAGADYGLVVLRRFLLIGLGGYALAEAGLLLGIPWSAYDALLNVTLLLISLLLAGLVLRYRQPVADLLRAAPLTAEETAEGVSDSRRLLRAIRDRIGAVWHICVIAWLLAAWAVWALAIENGLHALTIGTLLTLAIVIGAWLLDEAAQRGLRGLLRPPPDADDAQVRLAARIAPYAPLLRGLLALTLTAGALVLLLETWGLDSLDWFRSGALGWQLVRTLLSIGTTLLLALLVWEIANGMIRRRLEMMGRERDAAAGARMRTLLPMLRTVVGVVIATFVVLNTLSQLGVNVAPLLAGAGVIGLAVGFGSQTLVRDVITGIFLLLEDAVAVGDVVQLGGLTGVVEHLSIRSIKLRATDGSLHIIPFSAVTTVTNMTRDFAFAVIDITIPYTEDVERVLQALREVGAEMRLESKLAPHLRDDIDVWGIDKLNDASLTVRARMKTDPTQRWPVARELNGRIKRRFDELGIRMQTPQSVLMLEGPAATAALTG